jgi:malonate-semialdehyde dehydrogenase (acetylating)/methylmalonate-semialdehyde dehydrogenase
VKTITHWIANKPVERGDRRIPVTSAWDNKAFAEVCLADTAVRASAVEAAHAAFIHWSNVPVKERVQPLFRFKALAEAHMEHLAASVSRESGKTVAEAQAGIEKGLECVEFACSLPQLLSGELLEVSREVDCHARRFPLGIAVGITPFNFPAMVPLWMFPLAIACGNTFLLKPSEQVPCTPLLLAELLAEAGLPPGVFNVVQGDRETVEALLDDPAIAVAAFVGSTPVARAVYERGTMAGKRTLALGGAKNHLIVVPDADPALTAKNIVASATGCAGQRCMAASVLIAVGDCDAILAAIAEEMRNVVPGQNMGAIISEAARNRILGYLDRAEASGATLVVDGRKNLPTEGYFVGPTLIDRVAPGSPWATEEIFGPVLTVLRVDTLDDALAIENASPYGNACSIFTTSGAVARYVEMRASAGMIGVNIGVPVPREPFSFGGWNDSRFGNGDITGKDGIAFWTKLKKTTTKWSVGAARNWMS